MMEKQDLDKLIEVTNLIEDSYRKLGMPSPLSLPHIVVVGAQSSGKTSVLEKFVGKDFLPRGPGIMTRRPLVLNLINSNEEYGVLAHVPGENIYDFEVIREEILKETERSIPSKTDISGEEIHLTIYSPNVVNLKLIDLPGMTRVPVSGQPEDIEDQVRKLILKYITNPNTIILAVTAATQDLTTSDALKIARDVDPKGTRTLGVLTKMDLIDGDILDILENKILPLRLGYIGTVNRSQKQTEENMSMKEANEFEQEFFQNHPTYKHMIPKIGSAYLASVLNEELTQQFHKQLPKIRNQLELELRFRENEIQKYNFKDHGELFKKLIENFSNRFIGSIDGSACSSIDVKELTAGANIHILFHKQFPYNINKIKVDDEEIRGETEIAIRNMHGIRTGIFTPDTAFDSIVKGQINRLKAPSMNLLNSVTDELKQEVISCTNELDFPPALKEVTIKEILANIEENRDKTAEEIEKFFLLETCYINKKHEDFIYFYEETKKEAPDEIKFIKKGYLTLHNTGMIKGANEYFFTLTSEKLSWYKDGEMKSKKSAINLKNLIFLEADSGVVKKKKFKFELFNYAEKKIAVLLSCENEEEFDEWKSSFKLVGVKDMSGEKEQQLPALDVDLTNQVANIIKFLQSYMKIERRTVQDQIPKYITLFSINETKTFMAEHLYKKLSATYDVAELCTGSKTTLKKENAEKVIEICSNVLGLLSQYDE